MDDRSEGRSSMRPTFAWNPKLAPDAEDQDDCLESAAIRAAYDVAGLPPPPTARPMRATPTEPDGLDFDAAFDSAFTDPVAPEPEPPPPPAPVLEAAGIDDEASVAPSTRSASVPPARAEPAPNASKRRMLLAVALLGGALGAGLAALLMELGRAGPIGLGSAVMPPAAALVFEKEQSAFAAPSSQEGPAPVPAEDAPPARASERVADGAPAARPPSERPTKKVRPRVLIERAPYRSIPLKPGEKMAVFPVN